MTDVLTNVIGFHPTQTENGIGNYVTRHFAKDATATGDDARVAVGDPVIQTAAGTVKKMLAANSDDGTFVGVVASILDSTGKPKEFRSTQSGAVSLSAESTDTFLVITGTDVVYRVATQLSAMTTVSAQAYVGENANVAYLSAGSLETRLGRSTAYITPTASADSAFKIVGVSVAVGEEPGHYFEVVTNKGVNKNNTSGV